MVPRVHALPLRRLRLRNGQRALARRRLPLPLCSPSLFVAQACIDLRLSMQASCNDDQILTLVFRDDAHFKELLGFTAWPAPTTKSRLAMQKARPRPLRSRRALAPNPPHRPSLDARPPRSPPASLPSSQVSIPPMTRDELRLREAYHHLGVRGAEALLKKSMKAKSELSYMEYDKKTQSVLFVLNVSNFINSKRVGGAGLGALPPSKMYKYDIVKGWVDKSEPASLPSKVQSTYARPEWPHGR